LSCNISSSEFLPEAYMATRNDRKDGYGGIIIVYKDSLLVEEPPFDQGEIISIKIETFEKPVILSSCCRPPKSTEDHNIQLIHSMSNILRKYKNSPHWICGDINNPDIDWSTKSISGTQYPRKLNEVFFDAVDNTNLTQTVDFTTHKVNAVSP